MELPARSLPRPNANIHPQFPRIIKRLSNQAQSPLAIISATQKSQLVDKLFDFHASAFGAHLLNKTLAPTRLKPEFIPKSSDALEWDKKNRRSAHDFANPGQLKSVRILQTYWDGSCGSTKALKDLERVAFQDLQCPKRHAGQMIVGKILTPPQIRTDISFMIENSTGFALPVIIKFPLPTSLFKIGQKELEKLYPIGSVIAVKEPLVVYGPKAGGYVVRVDVPSDIDDVHPNTDLARSMGSGGGTANDSWEALKQRGNKDLSAKHLLAAIKNYSLALKDPVVKEELSKKLILFLNRSLVHLELGMFGHAYRDASKAHQLVIAGTVAITDAQKAKALWRLISSAYSLRLYQTALKHCDEGAGMPLISQQIAEMRRSIQARQEESKNGAYDWLALSQSHTTIPTPNINVSDFVGRCHFTKIAGRGRGVLASCDLEPGDLLMVSKSLNSSYAADSPGVYVACADYDMESCVPHDVFLSVGRLVHRIRDDPSLERVLNNFAWEEDYSPADLPMWPSEAERLEALFQPPSELNAKKLCSILKTNTFGPHISPASVPLPAAERLEGATDTVLLGQVSMLNHSCVPNASECWFGDIMVIRASKHIPKDQELSISYLTPSLPFASRCTQMKIWKFTCSCPLCTSDIAGNYSERQKIMEREFEMIKGEDVGNYKERIEVLEEIARKVGETYTGGGQKKELWQVWREIGIVHWKMQKAKEASVALTKSLIYSGAKLCNEKQKKDTGRMIWECHQNGDEILMICMLLVMCYYQPMLQAKYQEVSNDWARTSVWAHNVKYGGGFPLFWERCGEMVKIWGGEVLWEAKTV